MSALMSSAAVAPLAAAAAPCQFCRPKVGAGLVFHMAGSWCPLENRPRPIQCKNRRTCFTPTTRPDGWCSDECKRGGV